MAPTPALIAAITVAVLLVGCTSTAPPTPSLASANPSQIASTSVSPSSPEPTPTLTTEQTAAVQAVDEYWAAIGQIEANPSGFSESEMRDVLEKVAGDQVVAANVSSYLDLKKRRYRYDGAIAAISTKVGDPSKPSYGVEVVVTRCVDQRSLKVIDQSGQEVDESTLGYRIPEFNLRQYTVVKRTSSPRFLVYGLASAKGECGA